MSTLIVGHDLTDFGARAARAICGLVRTDPDARVILLHVHPIPHLRPEAQTGAATVEEEASLRRRLEEDASALRTEYGETFDIETRVMMGAPVDVVLEEADREHAQLIAVGTHGRTGISHLVLGSVAESIVKSAKCPVLVVPASAEE